MADEQYPGQERLSYLPLAQDQAPMSPELASEARYLIGGLPSANQAMSAGAQVPLKEFCPTCHKTHPPPCRPQCPICTKRHKGTCHQLMTRDSAPEQDGMSYLATVVSHPAQFIQSPGTFAPGGGSWGSQWVNQGWGRGQEPRGGRGGRRKRRGGRGKAGNAATLQSSAVTKPAHQSRGGGLVARLAAARAAGKARQQEQQEAQESLIQDARASLQPSEFLQYEERVADTARLITSHLEEADQVQLCTRSAENGISAIEQYLKEKNGQDQAHNQDH